MDMDIDIDIDMDVAIDIPWLRLMPPTRKIHGLHGVHLNHGLEGIPSLNGFEWFRVVLSGVESFLVVLRALVGSFL